ncbi:MAG: DUF3769 domain-containing protein [Cyanobacteria bacterium J06639_1]
MRLLAVGTVAIAGSFSISSHKARAQTPSLPTSTPSPAPLRVRDLDPVTEAEELEAVPEEDATPEASGSESTFPIEAESTDSNAPGEPETDSIEFVAPSPSDSDEDEPPEEVTEAIAGAANTLQLRSDTQLYDRDEALFRAEGNVELRFERALLQADRVEVDLDTRIATAEGDVRLDVGEQKVRGDRLEYDLSGETGTFFNARGELNLDTLPRDTTREPLPNDPLRRSPTIAFTRPQESVRFLRFTAAEITFTESTWTGTNVRITNDPLEPPELELQSQTVTVRTFADGTTVIYPTGNKLAFDRVFFLPLPNRQFRLDSFSSQPPISVDFEDEDGGLFVAYNLELLDDPNASFVISPKVFPQQIVGNPDGFLGGFGFNTAYRIRHANQQVTSLFTELNGLVLSQFDRRFRAVLNHRISTAEGGTVSFRYGYRQRFGADIIGTQTVQHQLGAIYASPVYMLGDSGIEASFSTSVDYLDAPGEREISETISEDLADESDRLQLTRFRLGAAVTKSFPLWELPPNPDPLRLRFSSSPIQQGIWLNTGVSGSESIYTDGKSQSYVAGSIGIETVFGEFIDDSFDYTGLNVTYSNGILQGASPFFFDRITSRERLRVGLLQQVYGPFRFGVETTIDLETRRRLDSIYTLGYDRRTYGFTVRYNPVQQSGGFRLRIDDFNWADIPREIDGTNRPQ